MITFETQACGRPQTIRHRVDEPEPRRVLVERDLDAPNVTTFTVDRGATDAEAHVTITTEMTSRSGLLGASQRAMAKAFLQRLYRQELEKLEALSRTRH